jgi:hypothetical protein
MMPAGALDVRSRTLVADWSRIVALSLARRPARISAS